MSKRGLKDELGGGYGSIDSFTAAFPRGQMAALMDDDDDDDDDLEEIDEGVEPISESSEPAPLGVVATVAEGAPGEASGQEVASRVSWLYVAMALVGGGLLALAAAGLLGVAFYLM